ncbi:MAG: hypothetical protein GY814_15135 [Gammaproteobacteria bacterium]|nr:hypothetical protein [Gammaproteobacteria bacterium]
MQKQTVKQNQRGQSMVEYVVVLAALTAALLAPGLGSVGVTQDDTDSLLRAVASKHRGHGYALSLSEIPETDTLSELSEYYDSLGKYPDLSAQLASGADVLDQLASTLNTADSTLKNFDLDAFEDPFGSIDWEPDLGIFDTLY